MISQCQLSILIVYQIYTETWLSLKIIISDKSVMNIKEVFAQIMRLQIKLFKALNAIATHSSKCAEFIKVPNAKKKHSFEPTKVKTSDILIIKSESWRQTSASLWLSIFALSDSVSHFHIALFCIYAMA